MRNFVKTYFMSVQGETSTAKCVTLNVRHGLPNERGCRRMRFYSSHRTFYKGDWRIGDVYCKSEARKVDMYELIIIRIWFPMKG